MGKNKSGKGIIFKIKRFSLHDGPGIRTAVFLKGCPLKCIWCHSPEGISNNISIWYNRNQCVLCGKCVESCPENALGMIRKEDAYIKIDRELCSLSGKCVKICPSGAMQFTGYSVSTSEVISEIEKDILYYDTSGGGITLTGGEPLHQPDFSSKILSECKKRKIHTAIETSLYCNRDTLDMIIENVDLFIVDLKLYNHEQHLYYTGVSNKMIKENFLYIAQMNKEILVRIPMIKNITDTVINLKSIENFVHNTRKDLSIEYLTYNPLTENNYNKLNIPFLLKF